MVQVFPFKAIRPEASLAEKVAELPYDVVNSQEAAAFAQGNPYERISTLTVRRSTCQESILMIHRCIKKRQKILHLFKKQAG